LREHSPIGQPSLYGTWPWFPTMPPCVCGPIKFFASLHIAFRRWRIWESLQAYGRLHLWIESWVNLCCILSTWVEVEVLPVHLALFHLMCLHDMLCGSLGVIKFDIELVILYFFKNLLILLILKWIVYYLGWPLIDILTCDVLWLAYF